MMVMESHFARIVDAISSFSTHEGIFRLRFAVAARTVRAMVNKDGGCDRDHCDDR